MATRLRRRRSEPERCSCGARLHYPTPDTAAFMAGQIRQFGHTVKVAGADGTWCVPRHYMVLHGAPLPWLGDLGRFYGWKRVYPAETTQTLTARKGPHARRRDPTSLDRNV